MQCWHRAWAVPRSTRPPMMPTRASRMVGSKFLVLVERSERLMSHQSVGTLNVDAKDAGT